MTEPDVTLCVLGSKPHRATTGYVCEQHLQRLADTLRDIEDEAALLSAVPSMQVRAGRSGSLKSHRSPAVLDAIVATDRRRGQVDYSDEWALDDTASVVGTLHSWARVVREDRKLTPPMRRVARVRAIAQPYIGPICAEDYCLHPSCERMTFWLEEPTEPTVSGERDTLSRSLSWIAAQPWVDDFETEMRALLAQLKATNGTAEPKPIARCTCGGPMRPDEVNGCARCGSCGETWTGAQLVAQLALIEEMARPRTDDGRAMMTVAQIVGKFGGNAKAVRMRLARYDVAAVDGHYDPAIFERAPV